MALNFRDHDDVVFLRAPLVSVLCQVRFEPVLSLLSDAGVAGFQEGLRDHYPHFTGEQIAKVEVADRGSRVGFQQSAPMWRMNDLDARWRITLAVDFVAIETPRYQHFGEFLDRFLFVLDVLNRTVHPADSTRIGLRKINLFDRPDVEHPSEWRRLLRPDLLSLASADLPGELALSLSDLRLKDGVNDLVIKHGFLPTEFAHAVQSMASWTPGMNEPTTSDAIAAGFDATRTVADSHHYLVDLDYSTPVPYPVAGSDDVREVLQESSDTITSFFHAILEPDMYTWLQPTSRDPIA